MPKGIKFPVKIKDISKFESLNPDLPGINVFSVNENKRFYPFRMAKKDPQKTIGLFLYAPEVESGGGRGGGGTGGNSPQYHYSLIKSFSRLFRSQITSRSNEPLHIC